VEGKRKFCVALLYGAGAFALCWVGRMTGGEFGVLLATLSALYKASNVIDKKFGGAG